MRRGQSTVELALTLPFIIGLLAVTLQGGLVISDQVNLEHFAYSGAQWAISQNGAATPTQIQNYIANEMCTGVGNPASPPSIPSSAAGASRFCRAAPNGVPQATLSSSPPLVNWSWGTVSFKPPPLFQGPIADAYAASSCEVQNWGLDASISPSTVWAGGVGGPGSATISISFTSNSPSGNASDPWPVVQLGGGAWPPGLTPQTPQITPSQITPAGGGPTGFLHTATATLTTSLLTPPGTYQFSVTGTDQCSNGPSEGKTSLTLIVNGAVQATPSTSPAPAINGVNPPSVCAGVATVINILGTNFAAGMTVNIGTIPLSGSTVVNGNGISGSTSGSLTPGVYNITVLSSTGTPLAIAAGAITVLANCLTPASPSPAPASCGAATVGAGSTSPVEVVITVTWYEPLSLPVLTGASYITLTARQVVLCQSPPRPAPSP